MFKEQPLGVYLANKVYGTATHISDFLGVYTDCPLQAWYGLQQLLHSRDHVGLSSQTPKHYIVMAYPNGFSTFQ